MRETPCHVPPAAAAKLVDEIMVRLRELGMRRTSALSTLLAQMADDHRPKTLAEIARFPGLEGRDQTTIYRIIGRLEDAGVVRRLGLQGRRNHYELIIPSHHHDYLVCRDCGKVEEAPTDHRLKDMEEEVMEASGWGKVAHELEFHGQCPECK